MNIAQAKRIPLESVVETLWRKPIKAIGVDLWFLSPFRDEITASFKINRNMNTRYDHGSGQGWTIIDFVCDYFNEDVRSALRRLEGNRMAVRRLVNPQSSLDVGSSGNAQNGMILQSVNTLSYYPLLQYLDSRAIGIDVARRYLKELHFKFKIGAKTQIALSFKSDSGAYEFRNALIKGCIGWSKSITTINPQAKGRLIIFEWFFDFLTFMTLKPGYKGAALVLNSTALKSKATEFITKNKPNKVILMLDNDRWGDETTHYLMEICHNMAIPCIDKRSIYSDSKDYNDYWVNKKLAREKKK